MYMYIPALCNVYVDIISHIFTVLLTQEFWWLKSNCTSHISVSCSCVFQHVQLGLECHTSENAPCYQCHGFVIGMAYPEGDEEKKKVSKKTKRKKSKKRVELKHKFEKKQKKFQDYYHNVIKCKHLF